MAWQGAARGQIVNARQIDSRYDPIAMPPVTPKISGFHLGQSPTLRGLGTFLRRLSVADSVEDVAHVVAQGARTLLEADGATVVLREGGLCRYVEESAISPLWKGRRFPLEACISGWCMLHRASAVIPDITQDPRIPQDAYASTFVKSLAMVPVPQDEPLGAIGAYWAHERETSQQELELLQMIANATSPALEHVRLRSHWSQPV